MADNSAQKTVQSYIQCRSDEQLNKVVRYQDNSGKYVVKIPELERVLKVLAKQDLTHRPKPSNILIGNNKLSSSPQNLVYLKASEAVKAVLIRYSWSEEDKDLALTYLKHMTFGNADTLPEKLPSKLVKRIVEQRFATTCWFHRKVVLDTEMPGIRLRSFKHDYLSAQKLSHKR